MKKKGIYQKKHKHVWEDFDMGYDGDGTVIVKRCRVCDMIKPGSL